MIDQLPIHTLLRERFEAARLKNPTFSLRAFSKKLRISPGALSQILKGKRPVSLKLALRIADRLLLNPSEQDALFSRLLHSGNNGLGNAPSPNSRFDTAKNLALSQDQFSAISDWWHFGILSLIKTKDFSPEPAWIAKRLGITALQATQALDRLKRLGVIEKNSEKNNEKTTYRRTSLPLRTSDGISSLTVRKAHAGYLRLAETALEEVPLERRDFSGMTFAFPSHRIPELKKMVRDFLETLTSRFENETADEVYQICSYLFPLTQPSPSKPRSKIKGERK